MVSSSALACGLTQFIGYVVLSTIIERVFYSLDVESGGLTEANAHSRKIQRRVQARGTTKGTRNAPWGFPLYQLCVSTARGAHEHAKHRAYASINLVVSSAFAALVGDSVEREYVTSTLRRFSSYTTKQAYANDFVLGFLKAVTMQSVLEYYWHVWMHSKTMYKRVHKIHHFYTSPSVWCDLCIHPFEAFGYYCILFSPAFVVSMPIAAFAAYMVVMGLCGVFDHSGVDVRVPFIYDTRFHDLHHELFEVNYAFPFDIMDRIHSTYRAPKDGSGLKSESPVSNPKSKPPPPPRSRRPKTHSRPD